MKESEKSTLVKVVVCGRHHEIPVEILSKHPDTVLARLFDDVCCKKEMLLTCTEKNSLALKVDDSGTVYIHRNYACFEAILDYLFTGELHMPKNVCPTVFKKELGFWNIPTYLMEDCCRFPYLEFFTSKETIDSFVNVLDRDSVAPVNAWGSGCLGSLRRKIWLVTEHQEKSIPAQVYMWFMILCVVCSVITLSFGTLESLHVHMGGCEFKSELQNLVNDFDDYQDLDFIIDIINCTWTATDIQRYFETLYEYTDNWDLYEYDDNGTDYLDSYWSDFTQEQVLSILDKVRDVVIFTKRSPALLYIDITLLALFTFDLLLRLLASPSIKKSLQSILNWIDIIVITCAVCQILLSYLSAKARKNDKGLRILFYVQMFRVLRFFRYIRNFPAVRVLQQTFRFAAKDLAVILLFFTVGITIFANFVYFAEDDSTIESIPKAWWWAVVTMTTVGYGDVVPKSIIGRIIAGICAFCGVILLALTIPVFVNTFLLFYQHSQIHEIIRSKTKKETTAIKKLTVVCPQKEKEFSGKTN